MALINILISFLYEQNLQNNWLNGGTSADGIDLSLIESDGKKIIKIAAFPICLTAQNLKQKLHHLIYQKPTLEEIKLTENELTILHANLVNE